MSQRPPFLTLTPKPAQGLRQPNTKTSVEHFEKLHARIVSRDYADDAEVKLSLLSHELRIILQLLTART
jgi:hypothetical protein